MRITKECLWILVLLVLVGCAATPKKVYVSHPKVLNVSNETYDIQVKPIKLDNPFYVGFQLTIQNKSSSSLFIDWNKTRYVYNGKDNGVFVFKGFDPDMVKSGIPKETITAGDTLSKTIYPIKKLGFKGKRDLPKDGQTNFYPTILPNGKNSVLLGGRQGDRKWRELLTFKFITEKIQK